MKSKFSYHITDIPGNSEKNNHAVLLVETDFLGRLPRLSHSPSLWFG